VHEDTFVSQFQEKKFLEETWPKFYLGQDPQRFQKLDPDLDPVTKLSGSGSCHKNVKILNTAKITQIDNTVSLV
jgi:hypothetical protein